MSRSRPRLAPIDTPAGFSGFSTLRWPSPRASHAAWRTPLLAIPLASSAAAVVASPRLTFAYTKDEHAFVVAKAANSLCIATTICKEKQARCQARPDAGCQHFNVESCPTGLTRAEIDAVIEDYKARGEEQRERICKNMPTLAMEKCGKDFEQQIQEDARVVGARAAVCALSDQDPPNAQTERDIALTVAPVLMRNAGRWDTECTPVLFSSDAFNAAIYNIALRDSDFCPSLVTVYDRLHGLAVARAKQGSEKSSEAQLTVALEIERFALHFYADRFAPGHLIGRPDPTGGLRQDASMTITARKYWNAKGLVVQRESSAGLGAPVAPGTPPEDCPDHGACCLATPDLYTSYHAETDRFIANVRDGGCVGATWWSFGDGFLLDRRNERSLLALELGVQQSIAEVLQAYVTGDAPPPIAHLLGPKCINDEDSERLAEQAPGGPAWGLSGEASYTGTNERFAGGIELTHFLLPGFAVGLSADLKINGFGNMVPIFSPVVSWTTPARSLLHFYAAAHPARFNWPHDANLYEGSDVELGLGEQARYGSGLDLTVNVGFVGEVVRAWGSGQVAGGVGVFAREGVVF